ncbi:MAG: metal ABC transporter substrate-binding protein [Candidatus Binatia bacterium]|nr:metal ABC transporter substrate-binding protein [Candidatus Binatia bacterium]
MVVFNDLPTTEVASPPSPNRGFSVGVPGQLLALGLLLCAAAAQSLAQESLKVVTSLSDFASIARHVGGPSVEVSSLTKGGEDPHFVEAKPSFVKLLAAADILVVAGMDLEVGYLPLLLNNARNARVLPGQAGYVDCSVNIEKLEVPAGPVDRSMGDVHPYGNPHYWLDPINGVHIAWRLAAVFAQLRPEQRSLFEQNAAQFQQQIYTHLAGEVLASKYDVGKLALLQHRGQLLSFLDTQGDREFLAGWWGMLLPNAPIRAVDDHNLWPYFARRFGIAIIGHMEPKPGIPPTTTQLQLLVTLMHREHVRLIFSAPYYDPRHARFLAEATGATIVPLAHLTGSRPGTEDYIEMIEYNVRAVKTAFEAAAKTPGDSR